MTTDKKVARRKLSLLELASDLGNVSKACRMIGYSRQQFYEIRRNFQTYGAEGLLDRLPGAKGPHPDHRLHRRHQKGGSDRYKPDPESRLTCARQGGTCQPITISVHPGLKPPMLHILLVRYR